MLILNADDFGLDAKINTAIARCFEKGLCSSCSIMPTMPGFDEAAELVRKLGLQEHTGIHVVLTEGRPLTEPIKRCARFCDREGSFIISRKTHFWRLASEEKRVLAIEIRAQIKKCRKAGLQLTHLDSHNHLHEEWGILPIFETLALEGNIPYIRLASTSTRVYTLTRLYRQVVNRRLYDLGLARTNYFGTLIDYLSWAQSLNPKHAIQSTWEVMLHPGFGIDGLLIDTWLNEPLEASIKQLPNYNIATSFSGASLSLSAVT